MSMHGYQGADKRPDAKPDVRWSIAKRPGKRRELDKAGSPVDALVDKIEKCKVGIRAKVEHPFRVIIRQFRFVKDLDLYTDYLLSTFGAATATGLSATVDGRR